MPPRLVALVIALLSAAAPVAAQESLDRSTQPAAGTTGASVQPPRLFNAVRFNAAPERLQRSPFDIRPVRRAGDGAVVTQAPHKRSKAPVVGGMLLGAIAGFFAGNYVQHSVCEYDCGPGGFTWGFTAIGAAGGAGIGLLLR